jgi:amino acid transporter
VLLSQVFGISRMVFAMARKRDLPHGLEHVHPAHAVPDRAVLLAGAVIVAVALLGSLTWVVAAATFNILVYYTITNLAALRMPIQKKLYPNWIPALGLVFCLVLAASQRPITIASGLALTGRWLRTTDGIQQIPADPPTSVRPCDAHCPRRAAWSTWTRHVSRAPSALEG